MIEVFRTSANHLSEEMTFRVFTPDSYDEKKAFPVLYMQDGQNVFKDEDAVDGESLNFLSYYKKYKAFLPEIIIVAIDCPMNNDRRTALYIPYSFDFSKSPSTTGYANSLIGKGEEYLLWIIEELKPWIDARYSTIPDARYTGIGGDSSAGVLSLYAMLKYPRYFQRFIALSGAFYLWMNDLLKTMRKENYSFEYGYIDIGTKDSGRLTDNKQFLLGVKMTHEELLKQGYDSQQLEYCVIDGDEHTNRCFGRRFPDAMRWVFQDCFYKGF
jgi:predicted alpha/beta superfamily hydrolase